MKNLCRQIVEGFNPQKIILFGSYAYGKPNADSDIDLLVIMPFEGRDSQKAIEIISNIKTKLPLDLLVRTSEQVKQRIEMEDFFMRDIIFKGKVLYETNNSGMD
ncbi:MAG: nucleotidyltransferase domain-containing protein [Acidobacteriota bacterium]|nr:nucleotidyltransferase domain-containing protein [Acidobacteriota bacterium]